MLSQIIYSVEHCLGKPCKIPPWWSLKNCCTLKSKVHPGVQLCSCLWICLNLTNRWLMASGNWPDTYYFFYFLPFLSYVTVPLPVKSVQWKKIQYRKAEYRTPKANLLWGKPRTTMNVCGLYRQWDVKMCWDIEWLENSFSRGDIFFFISPHWGKRRSRK